MFSCIWGHVDSFNRDNSVKVYNFSIIHMVLCFNGCLNKIYKKFVSQNSVFFKYLVFFYKSRDLFVNVIKNKIFIIARIYDWYHNLFGFWFKLQSWIQTLDFKYFKLSPYDFFRPLLLHIKHIFNQIWDKIWRTWLGNYFCQVKNNFTIFS